MVSRAVFLLGGFDPCGRVAGGPFLSYESETLLNNLESRHGLEAHIVFANNQRRYAGDEGAIPQSAIMEQRPRVLREISEVGPEWVFTFGRKALHSAVGKGNVPLEAYRRFSSRVEGMDAKLVCLDGLSRVRAQSGIEKWLSLDMNAALLGLHDTDWGKYTILLPPATRYAPDKFDALYGRGHVGEGYDTMPEGLSAQLKAPGAMLGFDLETFGGLSPWGPDARIRMAVVCAHSSEAWVVQAGPDSSFPQWLVDLATDPTITKVGSNIAYDTVWMRRFGMDLVNLWDTSVIEHIIDGNDPNTGLKFLAFRYLPRLGDYSRGQRKLVKDSGGWDGVPDDVQYDYCAGDGQASVAAGMAQREILEGRQLSRAVKLAHDLYPHLVNMQYHGAHVDTKVLDTMDAAHQANLKDLRARICDVLGPINPASPNQLVDALVEAVPGVRLSKNLIAQWWAGRYGDDDAKVTTQKAVLERESHKHTVIADVLEFRRWNKLHGTYVKGVKEKHLKSHGGQHFVHASFNQNRTETHRLSSSNPNLQNIPRKPGENDPPELNVKLMFTSRWGAGGSIMEADYSQAELRLTAQLSGDKALTRALTSGRDVHKETAATLLGKSYDDVTKEDRQKCKTLNFLILYGGGAKTLAKDLNISKSAAKVLIDDYFTAFPGVKLLIDSTHAEVQQSLKVQSLFGFERSFAPPPVSPKGGDPWNQWEGWRIQRQAFNMIIQNSAACVTFTAIVALGEVLRDGGFNSIMFGTVHDSILFDVYPGEHDRLAREVKQVMEDPPVESYGVELTIPMVVDIESGPSWGEKEPVDIEW